MIKTFRGMMAHNTIDTIVLHTNNGSTGYRIVKFQMLSNSPAAVAVEAVMKIYKVSQSSSTTTFDFSDNTLMGAGYFVANTTPTSPSVQTVIFDGEIFNQDIYVTYRDVYGSTEPCNYYIELEQIKLDKNQNTVATLKDIRNVKTQGF